MPWTLHTVGKIFAQVDGVEWLTSQTTMMIDADGDPIAAYHAMFHTRLRFYSGATIRTFFGESGWIQQEATFWTRALWEQAGARMDEDAYRTGDFELWARFYQHAHLTTAQIPLAAYRYHGKNKTQPELTHQESRAILERYPYEKKFSDNQFRFMRWLHARTGRFANRFGARQCRIDFEFENDAWVRHCYNIF